jgi:hypothetical protein
MLSAERHAGRHYTTAFEWSPILKQAVQEYRFWKLKLKQIKGLKVSMFIMTQCHTATGLSELALNEKITETETVTALREAYAKMRPHQKNHVQL